MDQILYLGIFCFRCLYPTYSLTTLVWDFNWRNFHLWTCKHYSLLYNRTYNCCLICPESCCFLWPLDRTEMGRRFSKTGWDNWNYRVCNHYLGPPFCVCRKWDQCLLSFRNFALDSLPLENARHQFGMGRKRKILAGIPLLQDYLSSRR